MCSTDIFLGFLAILFPPLPVWVKCGICSADSLINLLLCCLGFVPGLFHAWYIIARYPETWDDYEVLPQDREGGRVTYIYVQAPPSQGVMNYGTQNAQQQHPRQEHGVTRSGQGSANQSAGVPPSYADVVAGDHKVQSHD